MQVSVDIGGTKTLFCMVSDEIVFSQEIPTKNITNFCEALNGFLASAASHGFTTSKGVFACAGPISNDAAQLTNAPLRISKHEILNNTLLSSVNVVNDLEALAYNGDYGEELHGDGRDGVRVYLAPGTGLGVAFRTRYGVLASEAGHADLAAYDEEELALLRAASAQGTPEYESVLCGPGLERLYEALRLETDPSLTADEIIAERSHIASAKQAVDFFGTFFGRCARNFVITLGAQRVVLSGGVVRESFDAFRETFFAEFVHGRYAQHLAEVSVSLVRDPYAVVRGAHKQFE